LDIIYCVKQ